MIEVPIRVKLFSINELPLISKRKAIDEHRLFMLTIMQPRDYDNKYDFEETYNYTLFYDEPVIDDIQANEYLFFEDGTLAHTIDYCGSHSRAGETDLVLHGSSYTIAFDFARPL